MNDAEYNARKIVRFWKKVDKRGPNECWPWLGGRDKDGYGKLFFDRRHMRSHRVSFIIHNGPISDELCVLHSCDNPPCCNPSHLSVGTNLDNVIDMTKKMRQGNKKLNSESVLKIREMASRGVRYRVISAIYGVTTSRISDVVNLKSWIYVR